MTFPKPFPHLFSVVSDLSQEEYTGYKKVHQQAVTSYQIASYETVDKKEKNTKKRVQTLKI